MPFKLKEAPKWWLHSHPSQWSVPLSQLAGRAVGNVLAFLCLAGGILAMRLLRWLRWKYFWHRYLICIWHQEVLIYDSGSWFSTGGYWCGECDAARCERQIKKHVGLEQKQRDLLEKYR